MTEEQPRKGGVGLRELTAMASTMAAPLTAVMAAALYLAGYMARIAFFGEFGMSPEAVDMSLQATMAHGFGPQLLAFTSIVSIWSIHAMTASTRFVKWIRSALSRLPRTTVPEQRRTMLVFLNFTGAMLSVAGLSGLAMGMLYGNLARQNVTSGCAERCWVYTFSSGSFVGRSLGQDTTRVVILTATGTIIRPASELKAVAPFNPSKVRERVGGARRQPANGSGA